MKNIIKATAFSLALSLPTLASDVQDDSAAAAAASTSTRPTVEIALSALYVDFGGVNKMEVHGFFTKQGKAKKATLYKTFIKDGGQQNGSIAESSNDKIVINFGSATFATYPETDIKKIEPQTINPAITLPENVENTWSIKLCLHLDTGEKQYRDFGPSLLKNDSGLAISKINLFMMGGNLSALNIYTPYTYTP